MFIKVGNIVIITTLYSNYLGYYFELMSCQLVNEESTPYFAVAIITFGQIKII